MNFDFSALLVASGILTPIILGIVSALKSAHMPSTYAPLVSILLGVGAEFLVVGALIPSPSVGVTVLLGIGVGLSASGLYSGGSKILGTMKR